MTAAPAGVILAGGRSRRMGAPKAQMRWGRGTLLSAAIDALAPVTGRLVVARAPGQALPSLPAAVEVVEDAVEGRGPLEGIHAGLAVLDPGGVAFVRAVDLPLLGPDAAGAILAALGPGRDAAVPRDARGPQPLAAAYRVAVAGRVAALLDSGERSARALPAALRVEWIDADDLPGGQAALANVNTPADLRAARQVMRENDTGSPAATPPGGTSATASAPASEVTAWAP